ncbi:hypothetical protein IC575_003962 [Cucumis melo]
MFRHFEPPTEDHFWTNIDESRRCRGDGSNVPHVLVHDVKNRVIQWEFMRSGETISHHLNMVLLAVIRLHEELLKKPQPVPNNCTDQRWRWFEVHICLELRTSNTTTLVLLNNF